MSLFDREQIRTRGDREARLRFHESMLETKRSVIEERRRLGAQYLSEHPEWVEKTARNLPSTGFGVVDYSQVPWMKEALAEGRQIVAERSGQSNPSKGSLEHFASSKKDFGVGSPVLELALSPAFLVPVISYLGMLPIVFVLAISRAASASLLPTSSHLLHLDPEDTTQVKAFTYLTETDEDIAFHAIPAPHSEKLAAELQYSVGRVTDEKAIEILGANQTIAAPGPPGTTIFCDTNRCFHFGGRPGRSPRDMFTFAYALPTSTWFPQHDGDGERRNLTPVLRPDPTRRYWNALIGEDLVV